MNLTYLSMHIQTFVIFNRPNHINMVLIMDRL